MMEPAFDNYRRIARTGAVCAVAALYAAGTPVAAQSRSAKTTSGSTAGRTSSYSAASSNARKARLASARAAAQLALPRYKVDGQGAVVPDVRAEAAIIYNPATGQVLWAEKAYDQRSIASITKVMTAVCFLETNPDLGQDVFIDLADVRGANTTYLRAYEKVSVQNLLHLLLIASDNAAARTLARVSSFGSQGFVARMNEKAAELGLTSTHYADPSGLLPENVSSAYDMARLITYAGDDDLISGIMRTPTYSFRTSRRALKISTTNQLLRMPDLDVRGGKTGFISQAGYCLATLLRLPSLNQTVAVVVLGAKSNAGRFWETRHLFNWIAARAPGLMGEGHEWEIPRVPLEHLPRADRH
jgi:serine-type D-Ala-D-Ala endopeptidase (penicillin-binding protein 7)